MSIQRTIITRSFMSNMTRRFYSEGQYGSGSAGATASSRDWGEKERAIEGQWARINVSLIMIHNGMI